MELSDYLDFLDPLDIRVKGTRIGLEAEFDKVTIWPEESAARQRAA